MGKSVALGDENRGVRGRGSWFLAPLSGSGEGTSNDGLGGLVGRRGGGGVTHDGAHQT